MCEALTWKAGAVIPAGEDYRCQHLFDVFSGHPVHAGSARTQVVRGLAERHEQRRRVVHEIDHVIKPRPGSAAAQR